jgi:hypothetical protein
VLIGRGDPEAVMVVVVPGQGVCPALKEKQLRK